MAKKQVSSKATLDALEAAIRAGDAKVAKTLRRGASAPALAKLAKVVGALPYDVRAWLAWHDGQDGTVSIGPSENDRALSAVAIAEAWRFLDEEGHAPWKRTWIPLLENGAGDYVVYDRDGGALHRYLHDDKQRPKVAASLAAWVEGVTAAWKAVVASAKPGAVAGWTRVASPAKAVLAKKPVGTAYYFKATSPYIGKGVFVHLYWKRAKNEWLQATNSTLEKGWTSISNNLVFATEFPDGGTANHLAEDEVFRDGKDAPHAGLYERHFETPPFPKK